MKKFTEHQFRAHDEMRKELEGLLANPTLQHAISIIEEKAKARGVPEPKPHAHLDTLTTQRYCRLQGMQFAVDLLWRMTEPNPLEPENDESPADLTSLDFFHTLPEVMQEAYRKQQQK